MPTDEPADSSPTDSDTHATARGLPEHDRAFRENDCAVIDFADVVVVGARCAGSAAAITFARAGRRVVVVDSARFPSDTLSTHLLWPAGIAEVAALGALDRVLALGAPPLRIAFAAGAGQVVRAPFTAVKGIDYAMCVRRIGFDAALVATARAAGATVHESMRVTELIRDGGRVAGVRAVDRAGATHEIRARLVVGADGRRSTVARLTGALDPYRSKASGRACYFAYWRDGRPEWRTTAAQWRAGDLLGTAFPCEDGAVLSLIQPPVTRGPRTAGQTEQRYRDMVAAIPELAARLADCEPIGRVRSATDIVSYFRRSSGPGWALPGDAGHFKDPVTAQGMRDAMRYGRLLGEYAAPVLDDPSALDQALTRWEHRREQDCLPMYQWTNRLARGTEMTPLEAQLYRAGAADPHLAGLALDVMTRARTPDELLTPARAAKFAMQALAHAPATAVVDTVIREVCDTAQDWRERQAARWGSAWSRWPRAVRK
ncbi:NAD(P)/FAD-dependent oxidoreductase [Nocardia africana]|uniref:Anaerobic glycerol-3-phosphate dehydrogenase n=1 Tax=Nocardia africana TaxID=134964 RepID=A0A378WWH4_9NOCA|nr:NAD(P)/FAD-dependent oxidoreductase [Nocardia africana]MCC3313512.1 FAD-dependent monooxygenase [Nocardia africana]SUA45117.1 Anaerobic glycerol-3-phosphate dehydrogenase [Nocardia africana]